MLEPAGQSQAPRFSLVADLTPSQTHSKGVTELSVRCETIKLLGGDVGENAGDPGLVTALDTAPNAWSLEEKVSKLDFMKTENSCSAEDTVKRIRQPQAGESALGGHMR